MKKVVFACLHNADRSQIAAGFFNSLADPLKAIGVSAGTEPAERIHPEVIEVMREVGIDLLGKRPRRLSEETVAGATLLVTMGCGEEYPSVPGMRRTDWALADPKGQGIEPVRAIRDEVRRRVEELVLAEGVRK